MTGSGAFYFLIWVGRVSGKMQVKIRDVTIRFSGWIKNQFYRHLSKEGVMVIMAAWKDYTGRRRMFLRRRLR